MSVLRPAVTTVAGFTLLLGLAVPAAFTGLAGVALPHQAGGSLLQREGRVVGSALIGQAFAGAGYFQPRPSAAGAGYDASAGAASQLGPTSAALLQAVRARIDAAGGAAPLPADAVTASGSGLDPHISPENAARQVARVAEARGLPPARVAALLAQHTERPEGGLLGVPRVNVLRLNMALDALR